MSIPSYPRFYSLPPFFTLQPVAATRQKQMDLWCEVLSIYCSSSTAEAGKGSCHVHHVDVATCAAFQHPTIASLSLPREARDLVMQHAAAMGLADALDDSKKTFLWWPTPKSDLVRTLEMWVEGNGASGEIYTLFELTDPDSVNGVLPGMPSDALKALLLQLEKRGKTVLMEDEVGTVQGVKFL
eukprot:PhM_4_TR3821/c0_g1_i1/m.43845/K12189/VPS25, EAP20; ESCRT-II complex subunit VPS25